MDENFAVLATRLGPDAVLIRPSDGHRSTFAWSIESLGGLDPSAEFLHSGLPFLILTEKPLAGSTPHHLQGAAINLSGFAKPNELARFFDEVVSKVEAGGALAGAIPNVPSDPDAGSSRDFFFDEALELKPNVFGVGININAIVEMLRERRLRRRGHES